MLAEYVGLTSKRGGTETADRGGAVIGCDHKICRRILAEL